MSMKSLLLPSLRGSFGDWIYYSCLIPIRELGERVDYANDIHKTEELSQLIQRALEGTRADQIARYLTSTEDRFFNSLVLATYGGDPQWLEVGNFHSKNNQNLVEQIPESLSDTMGFLQLNGKEKIFAIDGQHRLAGIKRVLSEGTALADDYVPALIVGHKKTQAGLQRTRRLFTTLNKTAVPVKKRDIIALDEDDVMAITARRLVESDARFAPPKIAIIVSSSLPANSQGTLTTISSLYDNLKRIFLHQIGDRKDSKLRFNRPSDDVLQSHYDYAIAFFDALAKQFPAVRELLQSKAPEKISIKYRHDAGGHLLFRPVGLEIITRIAIEYSDQHNVTLPEAIAAISVLPTDLNKVPFKDVIWNPQKKIILLKGRDIALELCRHMTGLKLKKGDLLKRYRAYVEDNKRRLPTPLLP